MKRHLITVILVLFLVVSLVPSAQAAQALQVVDHAQLLTDAQEEVLSAGIAQIRQDYGMDVVLLTQDSLNGKTPQEYADDYFDDYGYGLGPDASGVLFLLSMEQRDWYISTSGEAIYALTDYGIAQLGESAVPYFGEQAYYEGFLTFLDQLPAYFAAYQAGTPIDGRADTSGGFYHGQQETVVHGPKSGKINLLWPLVIGLAVAGLTVGAMAGMMNTKQARWGASEYLKGDSFRLRRQQDLFLYSNVSKIRRQEPPSNSGGSSVHTSASGRSHGGGGGKF